MTYFWFRENQARLFREVFAIEQLRKSAKWLIQTQWATDIHLSLTAIIRAHGHDYHVRMDYPAYFPHVPPSVRPTNASFRWTIHQYGNKDGSLCLEWGPDNWQPQLTGAHMLESAYTLFHVENPLGTGRAEYAQLAPSRHFLTPGQALRFQFGRYYIGEQLQVVLHAIPSGTAGIIRSSVQSHEHTWFVLAHEVEVAGEVPVQVDTTVPPFLRGVDDADLMTNIFFKTDLAPEAINGIEIPFHLRALLWKKYFDIGMLEKDVKPNCLRLTQCPLGVLILDNRNGEHFFVLTNTKTYKLGAVHARRIVGVKRMPDHLEGLPEKSVGIVGLGSAGSKIAVSLARSGLGSFFLVDHDVFLPENVERNELDWESVGAHKVDAVREQLRRVNANVKVNVSGIHLTGQESTTAVAEVIGQLGSCDLLIDATANSNVFNVLAAVSTAARKPIVWLQIFGGGMGGLIARSRPGRDPDAHRIRQAYTDYCLEHPAPDDITLGRYTVEDVEGRVETASDADVSIIAANATRLAVDSVLAPDPSAYAYSLYLIGLEPWWVFTQAMETVPIRTDQLSSEVVQEEPLAIKDKKSYALIRNLIDNANTDANPSPS